jgi:hypothetical protein
LFGSEVGSTQAPLHETFGDAQPPASIAPPEELEDEPEEEPEDELEDAPLEELAPAPPEDDPLGAPEDEPLGAPEEELLSTPEEEPDPDPLDDPDARPSIGPDSAPESPPAEAGPEESGDELLTLWLNPLVSTMSEQPKTDENPRAIIPTRGARPPRANERDLTTHQPSCAARNGHIAAPMRGNACGRVRVRPRSEGEVGGSRRARLDARPRCSEALKAARSGP